MTTQEAISDIASPDFVSDCCGAPIIAEDICSDCKEHCEPMNIDEDYGDDGEAWSGGFADNH